MRFKRRDGLLSAIFSVLTCGLYSVYYWYQYGEDVNVICSEDGKVTQNYIVAWLLGIITCGIYSLYWIYCLASRLDTASRKYDVNVESPALFTLIMSIPFLSYFYSSDVLNKFAEKYEKMYPNGNGYKNNSYSGSNYTGNGYGGNNYTGDAYNGNNYTGDAYNRNNYAGGTHNENNYAGDAHSGNNYSENAYGGNNYTGNAYNGNGYAGNSYNGSNAPRNRGGQFGEIGAQFKLAVQDMGSTIKSTAQSVMPTCKNCGAVISPGKNYCKRCGYPIDGPAPQNRQSNAASARKPEQEVRQSQTQPEEWNTAWQSRTSSEEQGVRQSQTQPERLNTAWQNQMVSEKQKLERAQEEPERAQEETESVQKPEKAQEEPEKAQKPDNMQAEPIKLVWPGADPFRQEASDIQKKKEPDIQKAEEVSRKLCPKCGKQIKPGDRFCIFCGSKAEEAEK